MSAGRGSACRLANAVEEYLEPFGVLGLPGVRLRARHLWGALQGGVAQGVRVHRAVGAKRLLRSEGDGVRVLSESLPVDPEALLLWRDTVRDSTGQDTLTDTFEGVHRR